MPLLKAHWTLRYLRDRVGLALWQRRHPDAPWLAPGAVAFLEQWLRGTDLVVEFGSGRSTIWLAQRVGRVVSVEHSQAWHAEVSGRLSALGLANVSAHLAPVRVLPDRFAGEDRFDEPEQYLAPAEAALATIAPDTHADLILVDGGARDRCAAWAMPRCKPGGLLVIDNANWFFPVLSRSPGSIGPNGAPPSELWRDIIHRLASWRRVWFSNGITDTAVFFVPRDAGASAPAA